MPHRALSRTRRLLRFAITGAAITFYWAMGWGKILDYHRRGACLVRNGRAVGRLPVRNVFGISPKGVREIAERARSAWESGAMPPAADGLINPGGLTTNVPIDPGSGNPFDREGYLAPGVRLVRYRAMTRDVNPETGIPGRRASGMRVVTDLSRRRWAR